MPSEGDVSEAAANQALSPVESRHDRANNAGDQATEIGPRLPVGKRQTRHEASGVRAFFASPDIPLRDDPLHPQSDLTDQLHDVSPFPVVSSGGYCDIYTAKMNDNPGLVALKRLRLLGKWDEREENMRKVEKVWSHPTS